MYRSSLFTTLLSPFAQAALSYFILKITWFCIFPLFFEIMMTSFFFFFVYWCSTPNLFVCRESNDCCPYFFFFSFLDRFEFFFIFMIDQSLDLDFSLVLWCPHQDKLVLLNTFGIWDAGHLFEKTIKEDRALYFFLEAK